MFSSVSGPFGTPSSCFLYERIAAAARGSSLRGRGISVAAAGYRFRSLFARGAAAASLAAALPYMSVRGRRAKSEENGKEQKDPPLSHFGTIAKPALIPPPPQPVSLFPGCLAFARC